MAQITLRLSDELLAELESEAESRDVSRSEHLRDTLATRGEHDTDADELQRVRAEYEGRIDGLETELQRVRREKRQILAQRDEHTDLVRAVESERSLAERRAAASAFQRLRWWLTGMDDE